MFVNDSDEGEIAEPNPVDGDATVRPEEQNDPPSSNAKPTPLSRTATEDPLLKSKRDEIDDMIQRKIREVEASANFTTVPEAPPAKVVTSAQSRAASKVKRTPPQEREVYGREFIGCSKLSMYRKDIKLGEGTFGYAIWSNHAL